MTPLDIAGLIKEYGLTGFCALLCGVVIFLFKLLQDSQKAYIGLLGQLSTQLQSSKKSSEDLEESQKSLIANLDQRHAAVLELSTRVQILSEKMTHGFGNIAQAQESFVRLIEYERRGGGRT
jgi:hypothetical protein